MSPFVYMSQEEWAEIKGRFAEFGLDWDDDKLHDLWIRLRQPFSWDVKAKLNPSDSNDHPHPLVERYSKVGECKEATRKEHETNQTNGERS
jgi:hypothetical protein